MAIGDTHKMLRALRRAGFDLARTEDSSGNRVWHIFSDRNYTLNKNVRQDQVDNPRNYQNTNRDVYIGKVAPLAGPVWRFGLFDICWGKPRGYIYEGAKDTEDGKEVAAAVQRVKKSLPMRYYR